MTVTPPPTSRTVVRRGYSNHSIVGERDGGAGISALKDQVSISEIMLATHEATDDTPRIPRATRLPQWIEIYNSSMTEGVNIKGWELEIQNADDPEDEDHSFITRDLHSTLKIKETVIIPPNQTVLIVSASGLHSPHFPTQRVINLFLDGDYRKELSLVNRNDPILSQVGFHIELRDSKSRSVDVIGNLPAATGRRGLEPRGVANYVPVWKMPEMNHKDGPRTSLIRTYTSGMPNDGLKESSWRRALDTEFTTVPGLV